MHRIHTHASLFQYKQYKLRTRTGKSCHLHFWVTPGQHKKSDIGLPEIKRLLDDRVLDFRVNDNRSYVIFSLTPLQLT